MHVKIGRNKQNNLCLYIGMDVHRQSFSLCAFEPYGGSQSKYSAEIKVPAERSTSRSMSKSCARVTETAAASSQDMRQGALASAFISLLQIWI